MFYIHLISGMTLVFGLVAGILFTDGYLIVTFLGVICVEVLVVGIGYIVAGISTLYFISYI
jgi:hypothetical protein